MCCGRRFPFGHERKGSPELLEKYGEKYDYETIVIAKEMDGNRKISSTYIREELKKAIWKRLQIFWKSVFTAGVIEHGRGMGIGFFSNSEYHSTEVEADASEWVYVTVSHLEDGDYPGITNVDINQQSERISWSRTNLFDCDLDLYGRNVELIFINIFVRNRSSLL